MKKFVFLLIFILLPLLSTAGNFTCSGQVLSIAFNPASGVLQVNTGYGVHYLCKLGEAWNGVSADVCKSWYSMFLTAQASSRPVSQTYDGTNGGSCSSLGSWAVPNPMPYYVALEK